MLDIVLPPQWPESAAAVYWHWRHADGVSEESSVANLSDLPPAARDAPTQVWTSARETLLTRAKIPTRSPKKIMQALPYVLEDLLLEEPEKLDFAYVRDATGDLAVAVTSKARIAAWREAIRAAGLRVQRALPGFLAVPSAPGAWTACIMGPELLVRTGLMEGFSCPADAERPPPVLVHALAEARAKDNAPQQLIVYGPPAGFASQAWQDTLGVNIVTERKPIWDEPDTAPAGLSLYRADGGSSLPSLLLPLRPFLPAAVLLLVWFLGSVAFDLTEWWQLRRAYGHVSAEMHATFTRAFPETKTILDPARQMQTELGRLQRLAAGSSDFLPMLERVGKAVGGRPDLTIKSIAYREHQLTVELTAANSEAIDQIKHALNASGGPTQLLSTTKRADGVEARLRLAASKTASPGP